MEELLQKPGYKPPENLMLEIRIGSLLLKNPVMLAAGAYRYDRGAGRWLENGLTRPIVRHLTLAPLGAIVTKTITMEPRKGNPEPQVVRTAGGVLNSIGLTNPGCSAFLKEVMPLLEGAGVPVIVSITGKTMLELETLAGKIQEDGRAAAIELNLSCPNTGSRVFDRQRVLSHIRTVVGACNLPVLVKVGPTLPLFPQELAEMAAREGAVALTVGNSYPGMAIDVWTRRPRLGGITGGLSGPAIKPLALLTVYQAAQTKALPVIGCGGVRTGEDAVEFLLAGAAAVQVGSACLTNPLAPLRVVWEIARYCRRTGTRVPDLVGAGRITEIRAASSTAVETA